MTASRMVLVKARCEPLVAASTTPVEELNPPDEPPPSMLSFVASHARKPPSLRLVAPLPEPADEAWLESVIASMSMRRSTPFFATSRASSDLRPAFEVLSCVREMMSVFSEICV